MTYENSTPQRKRAALYVRVSTLYQVDKDSLPFQKQELENYCKYVLGIEEFEVFEDAGYSGKNTDRPAFQRMMKKVRKREFTHVCVWKIDRISRNLLDFASMYEELKKNKITFVSKNEQFDTSSAMGEAMLKIILVFAELERKLTSERVTGIMLDRANKGLWNGARMPLGYHWNPENPDKKFPEIDEKEAVTVRFIYDQYEVLKSTIQVSRLLNNNKIPTKRGGVWTSKTVGDILHNPFYKGTYRYNYRESARGEIKKESEWVVLPNNHPGIISEEQWQRCNTLIALNAKKDTSQFRHKKYTHIFSKLLKCGFCGSSLSANKDKERLNGWKPSTYRCNLATNMRTCQQKQISDIVLGPFIFNYIANFVRLQRNKDSLTEETIEKALLSGKVFGDIAHIEQDGLRDTLKAIKLGAGSHAYSPNTYPKTESTKDVTASNYNITLLRTEEEKITAALNRLFDLYLFDPNGLSKKEYISKKTELESKLEETRQMIEKAKKEAGIQDSKLDTSFIQKASAFILEHKILDQQEISYKELVLKCDAELLKNLVLATINQIVVKNDRIMSITFKSGLVHRFEYKQN